ncbi:MAG: nuclear transport factor 2 family protein [Terracidiphilus sp.]|jgi:ketosteroid isomerase-like protein
MALGGRSLLILVFAAMCAAMPVCAQQTENEKAVWKLETAYWEDVKALDMDSYKDLWHPDSVGWPYANSQPARKDHMTDWIAAHTDKGARLQWFELKPADSQATENIVVTYLWVTSMWVDKAGHGEPSTMRITHTWIKTEKGWKILGGMSTFVPVS